MKFIHIKNLEKFHPGYKDRILQWAKIYFNIIQGDPETEMLHEVDRGRLISFVLLELQAKKPIPIDDDYFRRKGFDLKIRPMSLTINMLQNFISIVSEDSNLCVLEENRVEENRVDKDSVCVTKEGIKIVGERELVIKDYFLDILPITLTQQEIEAWVEWVDYRKEIKKKLTKRSANMQIQFLLKQKDIIKCIGQSIQNQWQGLFEVKDATTKHKGNIGYQSKLAEEGRGNTGRPFNYIRSGKNES